MRKIEYVVSDERLITPSGLSLVGQVLGKSNLIKKANRMRTEKRSQPQIKNGDILLTMIGLLSLGKCDFENVNEFHTDEEFYKNSLGIAYGIPSESSLRNRLDGIGTSMDQQILDGNIDMFQSCNYEPSPLVNGLVPVDIDVSPFDNSGSHKAGVSRTYKNFDGYAPIFAYIGTEGYLCNAELREGKQHCQSGTPEFLAETIAAAKQMTKKPLLFRMDSGNDALENMLLLHWQDPQLKFLIKHNFRREDRYAIAEELKSVCKNMKHPREGKTVYIGSTWRDFETEKDGKFGIRMVYEIIERTTSADGQEMLFPEIDINMYWTSLGVSDEEVIALYHNHAVCEQYHSEIKTDMGIERLPSGKFETNALILKLTMIAYNILRIIGTAAMKGHDMPIRHSTIKRRRIRTVIDNLILIAGHLTDHARKLRLALGHCNGWICTFLRIANLF
jgi:hypothetical protein